MLRRVPLCPIPLLDTPMRLRPKILPPFSLLPFLASAALLLPVSRCVGETLKDVRSSRAMETVLKQTEVSKSKRAANQGFDGQSPYTAGMDPKANFTQLWVNSRGPDLLFSWIGANLPRYKLLVVDSYRTFEDLKVLARLQTADRKRVNLEIRIPHPNYYLMAKHKTLGQFNKYEPPTLEVLAQEEVEFNGYPAMYYRTPRSQCSVLFKIEKMGVVNLSVDRCQDSELLMDVAKSLDLKRLNQKLSS